MKLQLKRIREAAGKTQEEVAEELGIPLGTYRNWEQGGRGLNGKKLVMLADYYGISTDTILGTSHSMPVEEAVENGASSKLEYRLLEAMRNLNKEGSEKLLEYADDLIRSGKYQKKKMQDYSIHNSKSA